MPCTRDRSGPLTKSGRRRGGGRERRRRRSGNRGWHLAGEKRNESPGLHKTSIYFVGFVVAVPRRDKFSIVCARLHFRRLYPPLPPPRGYSRSSLCDPSVKRRVEKEERGRYFAFGRKSYRLSPLFFILNF